MDRAAIFSRKSLIFLMQKTKTLFYGKSHGIVGL